MSDTPGEMKTPKEYVGYFFHPLPDPPPSETVSQLRVVIASARRELLFCLFLIMRTVYFTNIRIVPFLSPITNSLVEREGV